MSADWVATTIATGDLVDAVAHLKPQRPRGTCLRRAARRIRLIARGDQGNDEYRLVVHPVVLGRGERLSRAPLAMEPLRTTAFSGGAVAHVFSPAMTGPDPIRPALGDTEPDRR